MIVDHMKDIEAARKHARRSAIAYGLGAFVFALVYLFAKEPPKLEGLGVATVFVLLLVCQELAQLRARL